MTSPSSMEPHGKDESMSSPAASRAKTSRSRAKALDLQASAAASGGKCTGSFAKWDRDSSSWRTSQLSLAGDLMPFSDRWPTSGSMRSGRCFRRPTAEHHTSASGCGFFVGTPTTNPKPRSAAFAKGRTPNVYEAAHQPIRETFPTPVARDDGKSPEAHLRMKQRMPGGPRSTITSLAVLARAGFQQPMFPTPRAGKTSDESEESWLKRNAAGKVATPPLSLAVRMIPTLTAGDAKGARRVGYDTTNPGVTLTDFVRLPTPTANDARNNGSPSQVEPNSAALNVVAGGKLNPRWVEWLMGWPIGWASCEPLGTDKWQSWLRAHGASWSSG